MGPKDEAKIYMKRFIKKPEDFVCDNCGLSVVGNGYTNHCPSCLFSKHVDMNPGDRQEICKGIMKPVSYEKKGETLTIVHRCKECGHVKKNKACEHDDIEALLKF
jgi:rubrerythrin